MRIAFVILQGHIEALGRTGDTSLVFCAHEDVFLVPWVDVFQ